MLVARGPKLRSRSNPPYHAQPRSPFATAYILHHKALASVIVEALPATWYRLLMKLEALPREAKWQC